MGLYLIHNWFNFNLHAIIHLTWH